MSRTAGSLVTLAVLIGATLALGSAATAQGYPPAPVVPYETAPPPPAGPGAWAWRPGEWRWVRGQYVWFPGAYVHPPRREVVWVPGQWVPRGGGWVWIEGHWR